MSDATVSTEGPAGSPKFEAALSRLAQLVQSLEEGQVSLADALGQYEEGIRLLKICQAQLDAAERKIELLTGVDSSGRPVTTAFDDTATADLEQGAAFTPPPATERKTAQKKGEGVGPATNPKPRGVPRTGRVRDDLAPKLAPRPGSLFDRPEDQVPGAASE